ncbi:hypothetical protein DY000_02028739 [Brassica cretica]|uniref:Uncharacterized protein n=1 Tax=Brassica cretica TaxID=69181 RepID=A0ABQ7DZC8_BRACR|nr:hypothetical protein DY000_02028739 [Brassica cretica]
MAALHTGRWKRREEVKNIPVAVPVNKRRRGVYKEDRSGADDFRRGLFTK